jgi:hypothetical protein
MALGARTRLSKRLLSENRSDRGAGPLPQSHHNLQSQLKIKRAVICASSTLVPHPFSKLAGISSTKFYVVPILTMPSHCNEAFASLNLRSSGYLALKVSAFASLTSVMCVAVNLFR